MSLHVFLKTIIEQALKVPFSEIRFYFFFYGVIISPSLDSGAMLLLLTYNIFRSTYDVYVVFFFFYLILELADLRDVPHSRSSLSSNIPNFCMKGHH